MGIRMRNSIRSSPTCHSFKNFEAFIAEIGNVVVDAGVIPVNGST